MILKAYYLLTCVITHTNLGFKVGHVINLNTYCKNLIGEYLVNISLLTTHNTTPEV